jgi:hypothetical protein
MAATLPTTSPNSFRRPIEDPRRREMPYKVSGEVNRFNHRNGNDDYKQPGDLYRLMPPEEKKALIDNLVGHMRSVPERIHKLQIEHFTKADPTWGGAVAEGLGIATPELAGVKQSSTEKWRMAFRSESIRLLRRASLRNRVAERDDSVSRCPLGDPPIVPVRESSVEVGLELGRAARHVPRPILGLCG